MISNRIKVEVENKRLEMYPKLIIDTKKYRENIIKIQSKLKEQGMSMALITKCIMANPKVYEKMDDLDLLYFGDSRLQNLERLAHLKTKKMLIRIPMPSEIDDLLKYADVSLESEISTIRLIEERASKKHQIILMVDLGDLREGFYDRQELMQAVDEVVKMKCVELIGIGVNLTCYGALIPTPEKLNELVEVAEEIRGKYNLELPIVSGGNSSTFDLVENNTVPKGITNLRIGEAALFGTESAYGKKIPWLHHDVFTLEAELIELKIKDSVPVGKIGFNAFKEHPVFEDRGKHLRGIVGLGRQDIGDDIYAKDSGIHVLGSSSDHLILDMQDSKKEYQVGDVISFDVHYTSVLRAMISPFVEVEIL